MSNEFFEKKQELSKEEKLERLRVLFEPVQPAKATRMNIDDLYKLIGQIRIDLKGEEFGNRDGEAEEVSSDDMEEDVSRNYNQ